MKAIFLMSFLLVSQATCMDKLLTLISKPLFDAVFAAAQIAAYEDKRSRREQNTEQKSPENRPVQTKVETLPGAFQRSKL